MQAASPIATASPASPSPILPPSLSHTSHNPNTSLLPSSPSSSFSSSWGQIADWYKRCGCWVRLCPVYWRLIFHTLLPRGYHEDKHLETLTVRSTGGRCQHVRFLLHSRTLCSTSLNKYFLKILLKTSIYDVYDNWNRFIQNERDFF